MLRQTDLQINQSKEIARKRARFNTFIVAISGFTGVTAKTFVPEGGAKECCLDIDWNPNVVKLTRQGPAKGLRSDEPSVEIRLSLLSPGRVRLSATVLDDEKDVGVGEIIGKILIAHS